MGGVRVRREVAGRESVTAAWLEHVEVHVLGVTLRHVLIQILVGGLGILSRQLTFLALLFRSRLVADAYVVRAFASMVCLGGRRLFQVREVVRACALVDSLGRHRELLATVVSILSTPAIKFNLPDVARSGQCFRPPRHPRHITHIVLRVLLRIVARFELLVKFSNTGLVGIVMDVPRCRVIPSELVADQKSGRIPGPWRLRMGRLTGMARPSCRDR